MRIYYQVLDKEAEEVELLFSPNGAHAYARIEHDRTGVPVEGLFGCIITFPAFPLLPPFFMLC